MAITDTEPRLRTGERTRLDKWLWAARFYKTRALAAQAVRGGQVRRNGGRSKPSQPLACGDILEIRRGLTRITIVVQVLAGKRGSPVVAASLYDETAASREARAEYRRTGLAPTAPRPANKPDKRQRRGLQQLKRQAP